MGGTWTEDDIRQAISDDIVSGEKRHQNGRIFAAGNGCDPQQRGVVHAV